MVPRTGSIERETLETKIKLALELDGDGHFHGSSGIGFFDHMLQLWARHGGFDLFLEVQGDLEVDGHHTVEDVGICLGQVLARALEDKKGIKRYGSAWIPMDEALVLAVVDVSNRPYLSIHLNLDNPRVGDFETELVEEFWRAFALHGGLTLHLKEEAGRNTHHILEAVFKAVGRALKEAVTFDPREKGIPSTKGIL
ncbi:MAG TPA: imidazoleglycerol-phosphate dehydratase HisB [Clostridia bacterium]|nr:imidazoleglycerol-phosphate dehydratase HisB [Clostridia bacterium]